MKRSQLPDGRLARFNELQTNKPLYLTRMYELTYEDNDLPTHYGFKVSSRADRLSSDMTACRTCRRPTWPANGRRSANARAGRPSDSEVQRIVAAQDDRGAWVEDGRLQYHGSGDDTRRIIDSRTFIKNLDALSRYVGAAPQ